MLTTNQKGTLAEIKIAAEAMRLGLGVYFPFGDERCDLILDLRPHLLRVQCKWASANDEIVLVRLYSARRAREGLRRTFYTQSEIDAFAAYCGENDTCYFFELACIDAQNEMRLRTRPTRNNQAKGIKWARDYEFAARLGPLIGPIAQLGERCHGMAEAAGSSPAGSIPG